MTKLVPWIALLTLAGCPEDKDKDSGASPSAALCAGPGCVNSDDCPAEEPFDGDGCSFGGNCHYCDSADDDSAARGYTCDGTSFTAQGTYDCTP